MVKATQSLHPSVPEDADARQINWSALNFVCVKQTIKSVAILMWNQLLMMQVILRKSTIEFASNCYKPHGHKVMLTNAPINDMFFSQVLPKYFKQFIEIIS